VKITLKRDGVEITSIPEMWAGEPMNLSTEMLPPGAAGFQKKRHARTLPASGINFPEWDGLLPSF